MDKKVITIALAKADTLSDAELLELFKRTESVPLCSPEFNEIIRKLFPEDTALLKDISDGYYRNTGHLLKSSWGTRVNSLTPDFLIAALQEGRSTDIQRISLIASAARTLFLRYQTLEQEMPSSN